MSNKLSTFFESHYATCSIKGTTGLDCPGCGMQRSIHALMEGDLVSSVNFYPALIPLIIMFGYLILHLIFKFEKGAKVLLVFFIINASIIVIHFLSKMLPILFH